MSRNFIVATTASTRFIAMMLNKQNITVLLPPNRAEAFLLSDNQIIYHNRIHKEESFSQSTSFPLKTSIPFGGKGYNSIVTSELFFNDLPGIKHIVLVNPLIFQPQSIYKDLLSSSPSNDIKECPNIWTLKSTHSLALGSSGGFAVDHLGMGEMRLSKVNNNVSQSDLYGVIKDILTCPELNPQLESEEDSLINLIEEIVVKSGSIIPGEKLDQLIAEIIELVMEHHDYDIITTSLAKSSLDPERLKNLVINSNYKSNDYQWIKSQLKHLKSTTYTQSSSMSLSPSKSSFFPSPSPSIEYLLKSI